MLTLYTFMYIAAWGYSRDSVVNDSIPNLSYGDCAQQIVAMKTSSNLVVLYADCVPQTEVRHGP